jgi:acylaminoacyl-peptidase
MTTRRLAASVTTPSPSSGSVPLIQRWPGANEGGVKIVLVVGVGANNKGFGEVGKQSTHRPAARMLSSPSPVLIEEGEHSVKTINLAILTGLVCSLCCTAQGEPFRTFQAEDVFALEWAADPQVSNDGKTIVYVRSAYDRRLDRAIGTLWTLDPGSGQHRPLISGNGGVSSPRFSPDDQRIAYRARGEHGSELRIRFLDDGSDFAVAQFLEAPGQFSWSPDGKQLAFRMFVAGKTPSFAKPPKAPKGADWAEPVRVFDDLTIRFDGRGWLRKGTNHIFVVSSLGGEPRQITEGDNDFGNPVWLDDDTVLAVGNDAEGAELNPVESEIYAIDLESKQRHPLTTRAGSDGSPSVSPDGKLIAYTGADDQRRAYEQPALYLMNADGSEARKLSADFDHPISAPEFSANGRSIYARALIEGHTVLIEVSLDGRIKRLTDDLGGNSLGRPYASGSFSVSSGKGNVIAYTQQRADRPADVAVIDGGGKPRRLTELNEDALAHIDLAALEEIQVSSSHDGRNIEAWVALPPGFSADGSYPMILEIHGGPYAMYGPSFAAEIQRFAAEGYVTVYVNPRGSTGYGNDFAQQIHLAYPGNDYDDLISVVDSLVERDYVDPDRLFVTGGSGGGVLTAWIVGKTTRFAAAASIKPVINWASMATASDIGAFVIRNWLRAAPWEDPDLYWRLSPISLVGNVTTPTLVMVGEEDWRTPTWEAEQFYGALKLQQVPTALVRVPGSSHFIAGRPSRLIAKTANILGWFEKYDPANRDDSEPEAQQER